MRTSTDMSPPAAGQQSTGTRVKEQGAHTAQSAANAGQRVGHTAMDQGRQVAQQARQSARGLVDQAQTQLGQQAGQQQQRAASGLHTLGEQLRSMADATDQSGLAKDLVHQASGRVHMVADWLEHREAGQALDDVRGFARRHPGAFLTGAAIAGVLAGRLTRNLAGGARSPQAGMGTGETGQAPREEA